MCKNVSRIEMEFESRTNEITLDELRELESCKNYDQQKADELIYTMKTFARIIYNLCASDDENKTKTTIIQLNNTEPLKKAA